jgi:iron complex outermembrane receptor protein
MLALLLAATPDAVPAAPPTEPDPQTVADIVVTADRPDSFGADLVQVGTFRGARLIDVPLTMNVVPSALLRAQAAQGIYDALRNTAGVSRSHLNGATYDNVAIRGILVENRTSYRLNGMLPVINLVDLPIENKDRVEVLKGVGALYYGFAPPSGIVNLVTKRADRTVTEAALTVNEYAGTNAAIDLGRRFGNAGLRFNGAAGSWRRGSRASRASGSWRRSPATSRSPIA